MSATGLKKAKELYHDRGSRARELKAEGQRVIGYFCCYTPLEMMTAAGLVPYRIMGDTREPTTVADSYLDTNFCPYVRSCFDIAMKGRYDFLDGFVWPSACDNLINLAEVWTYNMIPPYFFPLDVPHVPDELALGFFKEEVGSLKASLERLTGRDITSEGLIEAIKLHNENRALLRELYELRKGEPPLIGGSEVTQILVGVMSLPVGEANEMLRAIIEEVRGRHDGPQPRSARLLISGNELDDSTLIEVVEECGANVVTDDLCIGTRFFWKDVETGGDPVEAISRRYLGDIACPRTFRGGGDLTRGEELDERFGHVRDFVRDFNVNGAIIYVLKYCDAEEWDVPDLRDYLQDMGIPVLHIEHDYSMAAVAPLRTRLQAFVEMVV